MSGKIITREEMLAIPAYEISDLSQIAPEPLVSVLVITYNHEAYVEQAIEGILAQQCDFPIELIIGEDKSQDRTLEICIRYQQKHPNVVRVVTWEENVGCSANILRIWGRARGKYVASCEGDDYWIDPDKLTKQVALMEKFPGTSLCGARTRVVNEIPGKISTEVIMGPKRNGIKYSLRDVMTTYLCHTSTFMLRKSLFRFFDHVWSLKYLDGYLQSLGALQGDLRCLPEVVSVYRQHPGGICAGGDPYLHYDCNIAVCLALLDIVNGQDARDVQIGLDRMQYLRCHQLINDGRIDEARQISKGLLRRLASHSPVKALILTLHACLPRIYHMLADAWTRHKQRGDGVRFESGL